VIGDEVVGVAMVAASAAVLAAGLVATVRTDDAWPPHEACVECGRPICWCRDLPDVDTLCPGSVEHGCTHDKSLCTDCVDACGACVEDALTADMFTGVTW